MSGAGTFLSPTCAITGDRNVPLPTEAETCGSFFAVLCNISNEISNCNKLNTQSVLEVLF